MRRPRQRRERRRPGRALRPRCNEGQPRRGRQGAGGGHQRRRPPRPRWSHSNGRQCCAARSRRPPPVCTASDRTSRRRLAGVGRPKRRLRAATATVPSVRCERISPTASLGQTRSRTNIRQRLSGGRRKGGGVAHAVGLQYLCHFREHWLVGVRGKGAVQGRVTNAGGFSQAYCLHVGPLHERLHVARPPSDRSTAARTSTSGRLARCLIRPRTLRPASL